MGQSSSPAPGSASESSDALSSLQRVIADLKTTPNQVTPPSNSLAASMHAPQSLGSNLPANAPVFYPGASAFPASTLTDAARHRKAASLGTSALSGNFNSFSPHLGAMIEDAEDGTGASFEDGEISEGFFPASGHQARSQSQSFMAPRFAALAAQQEQDIIGPTGRPQLAPNFMFGARRRTSSNVPMGPLNEEDVGFQFPQLLSHARGGIEELSAHLSVGASAHVTRLGCWRNGFKGL
jgi:protein SSD1